MKAKKHNSMLGLAFEGRKLGLCLMRQAGGRPRVEKNFRIPLTLDPLSGEPELVGREIANHLEAVGIRQRICAVCLPLKWILTLQSELPELSEEDMEGFITLQAERAFPFAPEDLAMAVSRIKVAGGPGLATVVALTRHHVASLQAVLKAAGLRPVTFTLGVSALPGLTPGAVLLAGDGTLDLAIICGGGLVTLRSLDEALLNGPEGPEWDTDLIAQQMRITLGRLPQAIREQIRSLRVFGGAEAVAELIEGLHEALAPLGLTFQESQTEATGEGIEPGCWTPAAAVAARGLLGQPPACEFLPPHVGQLKRLVGRISARGALVAGGGAALLALGFGTLFALQARQLHGLEREWKVMEPKVERVEELQGKVRKFRPWFDDSATSLRIAARIASAFPGEGSVWVKSIEVKDLSEVTCVGNARSDRDWLALYESLSKTAGVTDLKVSLVTQGKNDAPLQFSLKFHWEEGGANAL